MFDRPPYKRRTINLIRPAGYRSNQAWQDWRAMKFIAARPIPPVPSRNIRTGGFTGKELKFIDQSLAAAVIGTTWTLMDPATGALNAVAQGNGESERIGRRITNVSLHIRGWISTNNGDADANIIRVCVVRDTQTNGAALTPPELPFADNNINSYRNLEWLKRFNVLYDKTFVLNPSITGSGAGNTVISNSPTRYFTANFNLSGTTDFDGTTANVSDITDNSIHVLAIHYPRSGPSTALLEYTSRFRYTG